MSSYIHSYDSFGQESLEDVNLFTISCNFTVILILTNLKAKSVLFKDLRRSLSNQLFKRVTDLTGLARKNLELLTFYDKTEFWALTNESVEEWSALFNESVFFISENLFFRDAWDKATWPSWGQSNVQNVEFIVSTYDLEFTLGVLASNCVLNNTSKLGRICHREEVGTIFFVFKSCTLCWGDRFWNIVELNDFSNHYWLRFVSCICKFCICRVVSHFSLWLRWTSIFLSWRRLSLVIAIICSESNWMTLLIGLWLLCGHIWFVLLFFLLLVGGLLLLALSLLLGSFLSCCVL